MWYHTGFNEPVKSLCAFIGLNWPIWTNKRAKSRNKTNKCFLRLTLRPIQSEMWRSPMTQSLERLFEVIDENWFLSCEPFRLTGSRLPLTITCQLHESESSTLPSLNTATYAQTKCSSSLRSRFYDVLVLYSSYTNNNACVFYYHVLYIFFSVSLKCVENVPVKLLLLKKVLCSLSRSPALQPKHGKMSPPCGTFTMQPQAEWTFDQYSRMVLINSVYTSVGFVHFNYSDPYRILWVLPATTSQSFEQRLFYISGTNQIYACLTRTFLNSVSIVKLLQSKRRTAKTCQGD